MPQSTSLINILSPTTSIGSRSQSQLGDEWWKTIYAIPGADHFGLFDDAYDPRGRRGSAEKAAMAQFDDTILFIGGVFGNLASTSPSDVTKAQRTIVLPNQGKATVFLPILNASFDNLVNDWQATDNLTGNLTGEQLQALINAKFDKAAKGGWVSKLFASVDGKRVQNPFDYRQASEAPFSYKAPYPAADGLLSAGGFTDNTYLYNAGSPTPPKQLNELHDGTTVEIGPAVSDGYWLAIDVKGGAHVLNFGGSLSGDTGKPFFSLDITYNILNPIYGTEGKDVLTGSPSNDYIEAGGCHDDLWGDAGDDLLIGGNGNDVINGGPGRDELWGDAGLDTFIFRKRDGRDTIFDFSNGETVQLKNLRRPHAIHDVTLPSGVMAAQVDFGGGDILTFTGIEASELSVHNGMISLV